MQKAIYTLSFLCCIMGMQQFASAQCPFDNIQYGTYPAPTTVGVNVLVDDCFYAGEYAVVTGLVTGNTYSFSTCGGIEAIFAIEGQITVYELAPSGVVLAYSYAECLFGTDVSFVYPGGTGNVAVLIDKHPCSNSNTPACIGLTAELSALAPPYAGGCGVSSFYCYGDNDTGTVFAATTPVANQAVSITLGGIVEPGGDFVSVRQNGVTIAGPFTGELSGTYTGAVGANISLYLTSDGSVSCATGYGYAPTFSISCGAPPPPGGCGVSGSYCYGDGNFATVFASTTPVADQAVSITLGGIVEPGFDYVSVLQNGSPLAGPFTGALSGTYTGAVGATISLYLSSDATISCVDGGYAPTFSISCATPPPAGGCGVSGFYCYGDNITGTEFASTTPPAGQAVSITLSGSVEPGWDYVSVRQNEVTIAGPFTGTLSGTYTGTVGETVSLYLTSDGSISCYNGEGYAPVFSISCAAPPPPSGGCGVSGSYCYGDGNTGTDFASTTPPAGQAVSITLGGSVESGFDYVSVRQNGVTIAGPFTGTLSGTYTGAVGATISLYLTSDGSISCGSDYTPTFSISCAAPPFGVTFSNIVNATCNIGGSVKANPVGGISPYTRLWSNGGTTATISNLAAGTYTVTVTSGNGATATASTTLTNSAIAVPTNLTTTNITSTTATFNWSAVTGAANYTILGRKVGSATWTTVGPVTGTSKNIQSQIACGKTYEWKVRANCAGGLTSSAYSSTLNFTTAACPSKADSELTAEWDGGFKTFSLSPNPANSLVTLYYSTETETPLNISIIDLTGRIILQQNTLATQGDNTINLTTNQLPQGCYLVELNDGTAKMHEKLVIAR